MKALKTVVFLMFVSLFIFLLAQCNNEGPFVSPGNEQNNNQFDGPNHNSVYVVIDEYVKVTPPDEGDPYYEWRNQIATFTCGDGCFNPVHTTNNGSFWTPQSPRYEGGNYVETQKFRYNYGASWVNEDGNYAASWKLIKENPIVVYLNEIKSMDPVSGTHTFVKDPAQLPQNTQIYVTWGTGPWVK